MFQILKLQTIYFLNLCNYFHFGRGVVENYKYMRVLGVHGKQAWRSQSNICKESTFLKTFQDATSVNFPWDSLPRDWKDLWLWQTFMFISNDYRLNLSNLLFRSSWTDIKFTLGLDFPNLPYYKVPTFQPEDHFGLDDWNFKKKEIQTKKNSKGVGILVSGNVP